MNTDESRPFCPDGTVSLLELLARSPRTNVRCSLASDDPAVAVYYTPRGCVARPADKFQALCLQHIETDGIRDGVPILDLTEGTAWSIEAGLKLPLALGSFTLLELQTFLGSLED